MSEHDEADYLWGKRHTVLHRAELSVLYHWKREGFFAFWGRSVTDIAIIGGSAAFANAGGYRQVGGCNHCSYIDCFAGLRVRRSGPDARRACAMIS